MNHVFARPKTAYYNGQRLSICTSPREYAKIADDVVDDASKLIPSSLWPSLCLAFYHRYNANMRFTIIATVVCLKRRKLCTKDIQSLLARMICSSLLTFDDSDVERCLGQMFKPDWTWSDVRDRCVNLNDEMKNKYERCS